MSKFAKAAMEKVIAMDKNSQFIPMVKNFKFVKRPVPRYRVRVVWLSMIVGAYSVYQALGPNETRPFIPESAPTLPKNMKEAENWKKFRKHIESGDFYVTPDMIVEASKSEQKILFPNEVPCRPVCSVPV